MRVCLASWVAAAVLVAAVSGFAQEDVGEDPDGPAVGMRLTGAAEARMVLRRAEALGLSPETVAAVKEVSEEAQARGAELREKMRASSARIGDLLAQETLDEKAALEEADAIGLLWAEGLKRRIRTSAKLRSLLTAEQREKLAELRRKGRLPRADAEASQANPRAQSGAEE
jgi:Spy/CpxP family protein refolding chaperone